MTVLQNLKKKFNEHFGDLNSAVVVKSPTSIILLGDHTHYNEGILISSAVDRYTAAIIKKRNDSQINILTDAVSTPINYMSSDDLPDLPPDNTDNISYIFKILAGKHLFKTGFDCAITSNIPRCIGLGSVSSVFSSVITALNEVFEFNYDVSKIIELCSDAGLEYLGKISNKAHNYTINLANKNNLMLLDLRTSKFQHLPSCLTDYKIVICDTGDVIENVADICNERIEECEIGVKGLRLYIWGIKNLRDIKLDFLEKHLHMIPQRIYNRCMYNVKERIRVENSISLLNQANWSSFGRELLESHNSLANDYDLSTDELNYIVEETAQIDGVLGTKMISCSQIRSTFSLIEESNVDSVTATIKDKFENKFNKNLDFHVLSPADGVVTIKGPDILSAE